MTSLITALSIITRLAISVYAFNAANQSERPVARALGLGVLTASGVMVLVGAASSGSFLWGAVGLGFLAAASYAFWNHR